MKVTKFDRITCKRVGEQVTERLEQLAAELGLAIKYKGGTFGEGSFTMKIEACVIGENGIVHSKEREDFTRYAAMFDLDPAMLDQTIPMASGESFTITGLKPASEKFPVLARRTDGKTFKLTADGVRAAWKRLHPETIKPAAA